MTKSAKVYDYDTVQLPVMTQLRNRSASSSKDSIAYNVVFDVIGDPLKAASTANKSAIMQKRGAFRELHTVFGSGGTGRGLFFWNRTNQYYSVVGSKLYKTTTGGTSTELQTLTTSSGKVWFDEADGAADVLIVGDGTKLYSVSASDIVTELTDGDIPTSPICPTAMDGYVFVIRSGSDDIYNSDVDDPSAWTSTSFISAEMYPDNLVALNRAANYLVAFGQYSTEFFYNNANPTGSPLRRQDAVAIKVGLTARDSVGQVDKRLIFVGQSRSGDPGVWQFDGLTPSLVSDEYVDRILANEGTNIANATGWITRHKGHTLYILVLNARTIVYDMDQKLWIGDWSITNAGAHAVLPYKYATEGVNNTTVVLHNTDGKLYKLDPALYEDTAGSILCWLITERYNLGSQRWKRMFRVELVADKQSSGTVSLEYSDDDYTTWETARTLDLTTRPYTKGTKAFRRRAFRLKHTANADFRLEAIEVDFNDGVH